MMSHVGLAKSVDQPIGALLKDLKQTDMREDTLVVWTTEFGRTPFNNNADAKGREHHPWAFSSWLAGGGVKPGIVHGATDEHGLRRPKANCCLTSRAVSGYLARESNRRGSLLKPSCHSLPIVFVLPGNVGS